jgi:farnesyl-diphosphate farnesyltransferase
MRRLPMPVFPLPPRPCVTQAVGCLNHLVADAMTHVPSCLRYLSKLRDPAVFRFCAIPQVMAIATLEELTSNPKVFTGVVKIRKGTAVKLMQDARNIAGVSEVFLSCTRSITAKMAAYPAQQVCTVCVWLVGFRFLCLPPPRMGT